MENQRIFKEKYVQELRNNIQVDLYKLDEFVYESEQVLHLPSVPKPVGLLNKLNPADDYNSAIAIYEAYSTLEPIQASDIRLWTYLTHVDLYPYMIDRWNKLQSPTLQNSKQYILDHWFINSPTQSALLRNAISGLWWAVYLSVDSDRENKYELTQILFRQLDFPTRTLGAYKLGRHKEAVIGILEYINENQSLFKTEFEKKTRFITKYLNRIGGVKPLSYYDRTFFKIELKKIEVIFFTKSFYDSEDEDEKIT